MLGAERLPGRPWRIQPPSLPSAVPLRRSCPAAEPAARRSGAASARGAEAAPGRGHDPGAPPPRRPLALSRSRRRRRPRGVSSRPPGAGGGRGRRTWPAARRGSPGRRGRGGALSAVPSSDLPTSPGDRSPSLTGGSVPAPLPGGSCASLLLLSAA